MSVANHLIDYEIILNTIKLGLVGTGHLDEGNHLDIGKRILKT